ncbi:uri1, prefoldin-like chaperone [Sparganum proliferum]
MARRELLAGGRLEDMERFDRLLQEQQVAIQQTDAKIEKLSNFCQDYTSLVPKLEELSKHFTKRAIVPFSLRAFVPAQLVHTNEVLVHLGGSAEHFCEMSTHQALSLLDSRIKRIKSDISKLEEQRKLLTDREMLTSKLARGSNPSDLSTDAHEDNEFEIREEYDPVREEEWLKQHKRRTIAERRKGQSTARQQKVRFRESPPPSPDGDTDTSSSECSALPKISFQHSDQMPLTIKADITDWSQASPADVVCYFQNQQRKLLESSLSADKVDASTRTEERTQRKPRQSPFGDVIEHEAPETEQTSSLMIPISTAPEKPVSRFRALCRQRSSKS